MQILIGAFIGLAAWFVLRFNLFCGTAASFRRVPELGGRGAHGPAETAAVAAEAVGAARAGGAWTES